MHALQTTYFELREHRFRLALRLFDSVTPSPRLVAPVLVRIAGYPELPYAVPEPVHASVDAVYLFTNVPDGVHDIDVACPPDAPYYRPITITLALPFGSATWPSFPDITLADPTKSFWDPAQPLAFRQQWSLAALKPSASYPFTANATLLRGTVTAGGAPLADATVQIVGGTDVPYVTGADGEYVIRIEQPPHFTQTVTLRASHAGKPDVDTSVDVIRERSVTTNIAMAP